MAFAFVALFVGMFIIYNTFSIVVAQRTKEMAMLRAIGARRGQVLRSVVLESIVVGLVSAAVGLVGGIGLSFGLRALLGAAGLDLPSGALVVSTRDRSSTALVVGRDRQRAVGGHAGDAGQPGPSDRRPAGRRRRPLGPSFGRVVAGLVLTGAGVAAFAAGVSSSGRSGLPLVGLGAIAVILGVFTLGPVLVRPVMRVLGVPVRLLGVTGRFARQNARRNPKRTAATASALMIGVAWSGSSRSWPRRPRRRSTGLVDRSFRADYVVESGSWTQGFSTTIEDGVRAVPAVAGRLAVAQTSAEVAGSTHPVMALDTSASSTRCTTSG